VKSAVPPDGAEADAQRRQTRPSRANDRAAVAYRRPEGSTRHEAGSTSEMYSRALGDDQQDLKCAARTARQLEELFILDGWPLGRIYGNEVDLAQRYGVGRGIIRETARILEARGTARVRRGRYGGLELTAPSAERIGDVIYGYSCLIGTTRAQAEQTSVALARAAAPRPASSRQSEAGQGRALNPVIEFYNSWLRQIEQPPAEPRQPGAPSGDAIFDIESAGSGPSTGRSDPVKLPGIELRVRHEHYGVHRTRAGQIFHSLLASVGPGGWADGHFLGNEMELCERFNVDRAVLRQAIRILEVSEAATNVPGRGHGLVTRSPSLASLSRLICCQFAAEHVPFKDAFEAFKWLGVETVRLAAENAAPEALARLRQVLASLSDKASASDVYPSDLMLVEERQFALVDNPILEIFVRSAKAYPSWAITAGTAVPANAVQVFIEGALTVADAVAAGDPAAAAAAQERKVTRLADFHSIA